MNGSEYDEVSIGRTKRGRELAEDSVGSISGEDTPPQSVSRSSLPPPDWTENMTARALAPHPMNTQSRAARDWSAEAQRCRSAQTTGRSQSGYGYCKRYSRRPANPIGEV